MKMPEKAHVRFEPQLPYLYLPEDFYKMFLIEFFILHKKHFKYNREENVVKFN